MANVNIKFNNKDYLLSCDDGQEESLKKLKELVNDVNPAAKVHIQLSELREFNIKVIGHLDKPGLYTTNGASRISSIALAWISLPFISQSSELVLCLKDAK